jgi:hypothetical protein
LHRRDRAEAAVQHTDRTLHEIADPLDNDVVLAGTFVVHRCGPVVSIAVVAFCG